MVRFKRRDSGNLKFHGPNHARAADSASSKKSDKDPDLPEECRDKISKRVNCGEQTDCPLRSKCKAGVCKP